MLFHDSKYRVDVCKFNSKSSLEMKFCPPSNIKMAKMTTCSVCQQMLCSTAGKGQFHTHFMIIEDHTVTVKCRTAIKVLLLYFNLCLKCNMDNLSCSFSSTPFHEISYTCILVHYEYLHIKRMVLFHPIKI
jgi:hypothetical protein